MVIQSSFCKFWIGFDSRSKCTNPTVFVYNPYLHSLTDFLLVSNRIFVSYIPGKAAFIFQKLEVRGHIFVLVSVSSFQSSMLAAGLDKFRGCSS